MTKQEFRSRIKHAKGLLARCPHYIDGYLRGLRRLYYGPRFGTPQDHEKWLGFSHDWEPTRSNRGRGYLDGLQGLRPNVYHQSSEASPGSLRVRAAVTPGASFPSAGSLMDIKHTGVIASGNKAEWDEPLSMPDELPG